MNTKRINSANLSHNNTKELLVPTYPHYNKMGWFATNLATRFLSCNEHLQLIAIQCISTCVNVIEQVAWITIDVTHHIWNCIQITLYHLICAIQFQLCRNNYYIIIMQLVCNYYGSVMLTSFFINPSKFDSWHYGDFWMKIIIFWNIDLHHQLFMYDGISLYVTQFESCHMAY
jgi:hypothetical protein